MADVHFSIVDGGVRPMRPTTATYPEIAHQIKFFGIGINKAYITGLLGINVQHPVGGNNASFVPKTLFI